MPLPIVTPEPRRPRILVIDDSDLNLFLIRSLLEDRYDILEASCGHDALKLATSAAPPDLLLLDIVMPDMDGYEVLRRLRQHPPTAALPVVFLTSLAEPHEQRLGLELGALDYLTKPVDPQAVLSRVEMHVREVGRVRRMEIVGERLARHLAPLAWQQLFHGAGSTTMVFENEPLTLLTMQGAELNSDTQTRLAFMAEMDEMALTHNGVLDRYGWGECIGLFEDAADALRMALALQIRPTGMPVQANLHHSVCDVARFRGMGCWDRTLLGEEAVAARLATNGAGRGIVISPPAYAVLREHIDELRGDAVVTAKFEGAGLSMAVLGPLGRTAGSAAWSAR
ncbi:MAG TPA: response regulator [Ramlibacter sp.]|nr:response regulator [Ramlibacter sp.]